MDYLNVFLEKGIVEEKNGVLWIKAKTEEEVLNFAETVVETIFNGETKNAVGIKERTACTALLAAVAGFLCLDFKKSIWAYATELDIGGKYYHPCLGSLCELICKTNKPWTKESNVIPTSGVILGSGKNNSSCQSELDVIFENVRVFEKQKEASEDASEFFVDQNVVSESFPLRFYDLYSYYKYEYIRNAVVTITTILSFLILKEVSKSYLYTINEKSNKEYLPLMQKELSSSMVNKILDLAK